MNINNYLKDLLYKYDRIVIPGFGAFISNYVPAEINKNSNSISPPSKTVVFRSDIKNDDGILSGYISEKNKVSVEEAVKHIAGFINEIKKGLKEKGVFLFRGIGKLFLKKNKYIFEVYYKANFNIDSLGATELSLDTERKEKALPGKKERPKKFDPTARVYDSRKTKRRIFIYTPVAIGLIFLFVYIDMVSFGDEELYPANTNIYQPPLKTPVKETVKMVETIDPVKDKREALLYKEVKEDKYFVIAGSFKSLTNANELINKFKILGFSPQIIESNNGQFRVAIAGFQTRNEAQAELNRIKEKYKVTFWVLSK